MGAYIGEYWRDGEYELVEGDTFNQCLSRLCDLFSPTPEQHEKLKRFLYVNLGGGMYAVIRFDHAGYIPHLINGEWVGCPIGTESNKTMKVVYGISRWSNASRAAARHIDNGEGKPLCGGAPSLVCR
jgi:hypothetical protein